MVYLGMVFFKTNNVNFILCGRVGKNGVYCDLVKIVKEAFEVCELVRIDCQGMKGSDFRKIGAKLKV